MNTPIADFVRAYADDNPCRLHMPGHKGFGPLGCEKFDITEVKGADALYEAEGIIAESEANATALFGSGRTVYSTEGSSQCIRAMLYLALTNRTAEMSPVIVAARNVHRAFVYAAALLDVEVVWLWPEERQSLCSCPITAENLEKTLSELSAPPAAVYITSPDYLGEMADIAGLANVCHRHGTILIVDNAHGAYLRFLSTSMHPLDLGADLCCDSAHKTLPVLTGGAYLHISKALPDSFRENAKIAMAMFGSTSPSYLTLMSLDLCNQTLAESAPAQLEVFLQKLERTRMDLTKRGWQLKETDPLRITVLMPKGLNGIKQAEKMRRGTLECEYADREHLVMMITPWNEVRTPRYIVVNMEANERPPAEPKQLPLAKGEQVCSIRQALFAPRETIPVKEALGRVCGAPTVSCPPAIPIVVSGERIGKEALRLFSHYRVKTVDVLK